MLSIVQSCPNTTQKIKFGDEVIGIKDQHSREINKILLIGKALEATIWKNLRKIKWPPLFFVIGLTTSSHFSSVIYSYSPGSTLLSNMNSIFTTDTSIPSDTFIVFWVKLSDITNRHLKNKRLVFRHYFFMNTGSLIPLITNQGVNMKLGMG